MTFRILRYSFIVLILSILFACVPSKPIREIKEIPPSRVIKKVEANRRKIATFRATGVIDVSSSRITAKANFEVLIKKPDSLKLSVYGPFGIELAQAVVTPGEYQFYDPMNKMLYKGTNKEGIIEKILKIDLSFDELMDAMSGSVNLTNNLSKEPDYFKINETTYDLTYVNPINSFTSTYVIDNESLALLSYKILSATKTEILSAEYRNFKMFDEVPVPYNSKIVYEGKSQSLDIEYRTVEINKEISDFSLNLPMDIQVVEW